MSEPLKQAPTSKSAEGKQSSRTPAERIAELEKDPHKRQALAAARARIYAHCFGDDKLLPD